MKKYNHIKIEKKWQEVWEREKNSKIDKNKTGNKFYVLDMFPYPSGDGLHMGHTESYTASDIYYRFKKMQGYNVLHPQGFDAFGLPAENFAIKTGIHPAETTQKNIENYIHQMKSLGLNYDFDERVITSEPRYYKWTQWVFGKFFENGLVYKKTQKTNWCPSCQTVIANEQVVDHKCERCGTEIEMREIPGWFFKITDFADDLIEGLGNVDWPEHTKKNQKNWIGRSEGSIIKFPVIFEDGAKLMNNKNIDSQTAQINADDTQFNAKNKQISNVVMVHGSNKNDVNNIKKPNYIPQNEKNWIPWAKLRLEEKGFKIYNPLMPKNWNPDYAEWKKEFEKIPIDRNSILIGASLGGAFLVRYLSEAEKKIKKLILIVPVKNDEEYPYLKDFFDFNINKDLKNNIDEIIIFTSDNDNINVLNDVKFYHKELGGKLIELKGRGHFTKKQMGTIEFPELLDEILRVSVSSPRPSAVNTESIDVFTTRPDTLFGATYMVLAPEHPLIDNLEDRIQNLDEVKSYIEEAKKKSELERQENKEKTGVKLEGIYAINPASQEEIPIFIADYVLAGYGTGAIMAVPAHDERDFEFAKKYNIPVKEVVLPVLTDTTHPPREDKEDVRRTNINNILFDPKTNKYAFLKWKEDIGWTTTIGGGLKEGESFEEAGKRELLEETGYKNVKFMKEVGRCIGKGFAKHKGINRISDIVGLYFELENDDQDEIDEKERKQHEVVWLDENEVKSFLNMPSSIYIWELFKDCNFVYSDKGELVNSGEFNGMDSEEAKRKITEFVGGEMTNTYRLRDWSISRQRYWGCPIPIAYSPEGESRLVPDEHLPWILPTDVDFKPTGVSPLSESKELKERVEKIFGEGWVPEYDTMDTFVDSSWYFLRYPDTHNDKEFCSESRKKWLPVDLYIGGAEHTYMHLLFARFFIKAMKKIGLLDFDEPFLKLRHQGMVLDADGKKMSKSKGNVINPDDMVERFGADAVRLFIMFAGPLEDDVIWNENGVVGTRRFLEKVWRVSERLINKKTSESRLDALLHKTIKKVTDDIESLDFNTAISAMMIFINEVEKEGITKDDFGIFLKMLAPFAPHIAEELWQSAGFEGLINIGKWPIYDKMKLIDKTARIAVQVDGKVRDVFDADVDMDEEKIKKMAQNRDKISRLLAGRYIKRMIYVRNKLVSIVTAQK